MMHSVCRTQLKRNILFVSIAVILVCGIIALYAVVFSRPVDIMDDNAIPGQPVALDESYGYSELIPQGLCIVRLCGTPLVQNGRDVFFYFTNPEVNIHPMRIDVYRAKVVVDPSTGKASYQPDEHLGNSGFIAPGSYIESVRLNTKLKEKTPVMVKVGLRNEQTGVSEGYFYLNVTLVP